MIKFDNITFAYAGGEPLFKDFTFVPENGINVITGASGSGKTTLLNLAAGLLIPQSGTISGMISGAGFCFQEPRLIPELTVFANLDIALETVIPEKETRREKIAAAIDNAGLKDAIKKYPAELSGGMAQRVALIRALLFPSDILLLDEPFKGLDIKIRNDLVKMLIENISANNKQVLFVTHDTDLSYLPVSAVINFSQKPVSALEK